MTYCDRCQGRKVGALQYGEHHCFCEPRAVDEQTGISLRLIRMYDPYLDTFPFQPLFAPRAKWELTPNDLRFLRSIRIKAD